MATPRDASNANLKPWKPGQSGNPSGRPKRQPISDAYRKIADRPFNEKTKNRKRPGATFAEHAAHQQFLCAIAGDTAAIKEIREAIEGKSTQRIELSPNLEAGQGLQVIVEFKKSNPSQG